MPNNTSELVKFRKKTFESHCLNLLATLLEDWAKNTLINKTAPDYHNNDNTPLIIFIEDRIECLSLLRFSILNSLIMCRLKMPVIVYTTKSKISAFESSLEDLNSWVEVLPINDESIENMNIDNYNKLLKDSRFWNKIPSISILIVHIDALLIEPIDFKFFKYDLVGAPWSMKKQISTNFYTYSEDLSYEMYNQWETMQFCQAIPNDIPFGNGGLSIRNTKKMALICDSVPSNKSEPEDYYFSKALFLRRNNSNLPTINEARRFSCETDYFHSIGSHASHLYLKAEEQARIYERHFIHLISLVTASSKNNNK
tara:strand:- start:896 stop:1831 length:936 start_codon:yes stop_codon:yes gene_type:complete